MADRPLRPATDRSLGGPLPHQQANPPRAHHRPEAEATFSQPTRRSEGPSGINPSFPGLSRCRGQVTHVLLTRSPLSPGPKPRFSLDLHVLSAPPAFVLSQDQTLREENVRPQAEPRIGRAGDSSSVELDARCHPQEGLTGFSLPQVPVQEARANKDWTLTRGLDVSHAVEFSKTGAAGRQQKASDSRQRPSGTEHNGRIRSLEGLQSSSYRLPAPPFREAEGW